MIALERLRHWIDAVAARRRFSFVREGLAYLGITLFIGLVAFFYEAPTLVMLFGMLCAPILLSGPLAFLTIRKIRVRRLLPRHAVAGEEFAVEIALENRKRVFSAMAMIVVDSLRPHRRQFAPRVFFGRVPPRDQARRRYRAVIPRRGRYRFGRLRVYTQFPFGFFERSFRYDAPGELVVYPRLGRVTLRFYELQTEFRQFMRGPQNRRTTYEEEYHGLRDFRQGDSARWIHWRTTARRGQLMVKEFEHQRSQNFAVLVDPWLPRRAGAPDRERMELAVSFAGSVVSDLCRRMNTRVLAAASGPSPWVLHGTGDSRLVHAVLTNLADQRPARGNATQGLFAHVNSNRLLNASVVVVSTRPLNVADVLLADGGGSEEGTLEKLLATRGAGRMVTLLDVSAGDLDPLFELE